MKTFKMLLVLALLVLIVTAGFVASGVYDIGADKPHWSLTEKLVGALRDRSIARQSAGIVVPDLDDPARIRSGARRYAEMCAACHLTPGMRSTELREGLYPQPPDLARHGVHDPAQAFWAIKHGIKMSAMPAWGRSHDDAAIWEMVAFVKRLPELDEAGFEGLAGMAGDDGHGMHHDDDDHPAGAASVPDGDADHAH
ncbi:Cytochrome C oxidase, cbb3-type, subunit III [Dyella sp. OK004]|uniref:c-type cytochrome n=1 Tax=Dyella sp. OK004 TaxID=1855292 RepID=UPI0008DF9B9D|nr:cytochrome c [Dyella sp. OK004]SFS19834.1 Cytochrome C oxidase, cbb3-type, subunit III [Dyella sp. OK004]